MIKKVINYVDFNNVARTEEYYFHMSETELMELEAGMGGGLSESVKQMIDTEDKAKLIRLVKKIILDSYGEKSLDGRSFIKNEELKNNFEQTAAFSKLFMEIATNDELANEFIRGIIPQHLSKLVAENEKEKVLNPGSSEL